MRADGDFFTGSEITRRGGPAVDPRGVERRAIAILNADVQGYSRLMADDEAATVRTVTAYQEHRGATVHSSLITAMPPATWVAPTRSSTPRTTCPPVVT